ncbi:MAG: hypothetical protein WAX69_15405, partial [Victivallales bacterium]
ALVFAFFLFISNTPINSLFKNHIRSVTRFRRLALYHYLVGRTCILYIGIPVPQLECGLSVPLFWAEERRIVFINTSMQRYFLI